MQRIGRHGFTKAWRGHDGSRCLAFREGCVAGLTFTIMVLPNWRVKFFYIAAGWQGRFVRWHMAGSRI